MRIALVYDRVNKWGGAERLLLSLHKIYPAAPLFTLVYNPATAPWASVFEVVPGFLNKIPFFRTRHEILAPLSQLGFESFDFSDFDVVISISSDHAKSVITKPKILHICYCLTPTRYLWGRERGYYLPKIIKKYLCFADRISAARPDVYLAISNAVKNRIYKYYRKNAQTIYPGIENNNYSIPKKHKTSDHYLIVGRMVPYKKHSLVIKVFNRSGRKLVVVGTGSLERSLKSIAKSNITFLKNLSSKELIHQYQDAKALIIPQREDFGFVSLEAQACGTPVIAYKAGGALETVIDRETGLFFEKQIPHSLNTALDSFESGAHHITTTKCAANAAKFDETRFINEFSAKVESLWRQHQKMFM